MKDLSHLINEAKFFYRCQNYKKASRLFEKVAATKKGFADVHNYLGLIAHEEGRFGDAIKSFKQALAINPHYTEATLNLSILYNDMGNYEEAKKLVNQSKKDAGITKTVLDPFIRSKLANKHAEVADWYHGVGALDEAIGEYQKALNLEEKYADIRTRMAVCFREKGDCKTALAEIIQATRTNSKFAQAWVQWGVTLHTLGKKDEARKVWKDAEKRFPHNKTIKMYLSFTEPHDQRKKRQ